MHLGALLTCSIALFLGGGLPGRPRPWRGTPSGFAARRSGSYRGCGWKAAQSVMRGGAPQRIWCATAGSDAGLPSEAATAAHASAQAESRLVNMAEDWQTVSRDLATAAASFEPSRFSMIACGRPTQVRCCIPFAVPVVAAPQEHVSLSSAGLFMFYSILVKC